MRMNHGWPRGVSVETTQSLENVAETSRGYVLTAPVLLVVVIRRKDTATRNEPDEPCRAVDDGVAHDTGDETVCDRVGEGHEHERDEGWDAISRIVPVDGENATHHHTADKNERTTGCPGWNRGENGCEEERDKEETAGSNGSNAGTATLLDTSLKDELVSVMELGRIYLHLTRRTQ
jgi:hypothetical protein